MSKLSLICSGNPEAYYGRRDFTREESEQITVNTGDYDASDSVFYPRKPTDFDGDVDAKVRVNETGEVLTYSYADGQCYSAQGETMPEEFGELVRMEGLVPDGNASDRDSLRRLIASVEPLVNEEDITLVDEEDDDND